MRAASNAISSLVAALLLFSVVSAQLHFTVSVMTDVHLEPDYDPHVDSKAACLSGRRNLSSTLALYGRKGCDSPTTLFESALRKMKEAVPMPNVIVVPGDLVTHSIPRGANAKFDAVRYAKLKSVIANYTRLVLREFPYTPILFTPGNDDYVINYNVPDQAHSADYYGFLYKTWIKDIGANKMAVIIRNKHRP